MLRNQNAQLKFDLNKALAKLTKTESKLAVSKLLKSEVVSL